LSDYAVEEIEEPLELPVYGHQFEIGPDGFLEPPPRSPRRLPTNDVKEKSNFFLTPTPLMELPAPAIWQTVTVSVSEEIVDLDEPQPEVNNSHSLSPPKSPRTPPVLPIARTPSPAQPQSGWQAPDNWEYIPKKEATEGSTEETASSMSRTSTSEAPHDIDPMHFQRFIRRMEGAGPKILLNRLKEEWDDSVDDSTMAELALEKHLSVLTALQMKALDRFVKPSSCATLPIPLPPVSLDRRRKILEIDGHIGKKPHLQRS
jgi:hypothetical protein